MHPISFCVAFLVAFTVAAHAQMVPSVVISARDIRNVVVDFG